MKLTSFVFAAGLIAIPALALAQSAPSPTNQSGPGLTNTQSPTDMGSANQSGNSKAVPTRGANKRTAMKKSKSRKGGMTGADVKEEQGKVSTSPASGGEGIKKEK